MPKQYSACPTFWMRNWQHRLRQLTWCSQFWTILCCAVGTSVCVSIRSTRVEKVNVCTISPIFYIQPHWTRNSTHRKWVSSTPGHLQAVEFHEKQQIRWWCYCHLLNLGTWSKHLSFLKRNWSKWNGMSETATSIWIEGMGLLTNQVDPPQAIQPKSKNNQSMKDYRFSK